MGDFLIALETDQGLIRNYTIESSPDYKRTLS